MSAGKKRVAIFGGTFNPIHNGHLYLIRAFAELLDVDHVLLMIANQPPHKATPNLLSNAHRFAMASELQKDESLVQPCDFELRRGGKSYTYRTLRELCHRNRDTEYYFLTGADMFLTIQNWRRPREIFHRAVICTSPRGAQDYAQLKAHEPILQAMGARTVVADIVPPPISSTQVRQCVHRGESIHDLVPQSIERYIYAHGLYQSEGESVNDR